MSGYSGQEDVLNVLTLRSRPMEHPQKRMRMDNTPDRIDIDLPVFEAHNMESRAASQALWAQLLDPAFRHVSELKTSYDLIVDPKKQALVAQAFGSCSELHEVTRKNIHELLLIDPQVNDPAWYALGNYHPSFDNDVATYIELALILDPIFKYGSQPIGLTDLLVNLNGRYRQANVSIEDMEINVGRSIFAKATIVHEHVLLEEEIERLVLSKINVFEHRLLSPLALTPHLNLATKSIFQGAARTMADTCYEAAIQYARFQQRLYLLVCTKQIVGHLVVEQAMTTHSKLKEFEIVCARSRLSEVLKLSYANFRNPTSIMGKLDEIAIESKIVPSPPNTRANIFRPFTRKADCDELPSFKFNTKTNPISPFDVKDHPAIEKLFNFWTNDDFDGSGNHIDLLCTATRRKVDFTQRDQLAREKVYD